MFDLGSVKCTSKIQIHPAAGSVSYLNHITDVEVSQDNTNWVTVHSDWNPSVYAFNELTFTETKAQFIRLNFIYQVFGF